MHYTLIKVKESDFNEIYHIKKASIKIYVEQIWGWHEQYQLNELKNDFKNRDEFSLIMIGSETAVFFTGEESPNCSRKISKYVYPILTYA